MKPVEYIDKRLKESKVPKIIYRWMTPKQYAKALTGNRLLAGLWERAIEGTDPVVITRGISFGLDENKWKQAGLVLMKLRGDLLPNDIYLMNGERAYWYTLSLTDNTADDTVYLDQSTKPDEAFVVGNIKDLDRYLVKGR